MLLMSKSTPCIPDEKSIPVVPSISVRPMPVSTPAAVPITARKKCFQEKEPDYFAALHSHGPDGADFLHAFKNYHHNGVYNYGGCQNKEYKCHKIVEHLGKINPAYHHVKFPASPGQRRYPCL